MSEHSKSKPDKFDPDTDYHHVKFENRCLRGSGDDFQKLFEDIMVRARPGELERVRPYGRFADRKCDGLIESEGIVFQVYSPDELKQAEVQKKINEDLDGAVQHWNDILKKWVFVYNAKRGTPPDIKLTLQQKQKQYPDIEINSWSNDYLWEITRGLSLQQRSEILGLPLRQQLRQSKRLLSWLTIRSIKTNWRETCRELLNHQQIATQMREGWLQNVRVVLTCRLNVWDVGKNALDRFDVYRNLDFDYPSQVHQFIDQWFATEPELQQKLKVALEQSGKERIRDMVKNPLRLTLLCYSWQLRQGELPETKAGLYEWFVDAFYKWNKGKVPIKLSTTKRQELNRALGELAKEAIDQKSSRFRLREKFVNQFLGNADDEDSLFYLALHLGWLNRVGVAEENPLEDVYAFFHPTFQEYFAALAIDDWDYFLPRGHVDKPINDKKYRVFELHWKESFLLWVGRKELEANFRDELLFNNLLNFDDGCQGLYRENYLFSLFDSASGEFIRSEINEITWIDEEDGSLGTRLSDKWEQRYTWNHQYLHLLNKIEEDFVEKIGHWMHLDEIIYEDSFLEKLSYFDFERRKLKENKLTVEKLKIKHRKELQLINQINDINQLVDGLLGRKEAVIYGAFINKILKELPCNPDLEKKVSSMLSYNSYKDIYPDIIWILNEYCYIKAETFESLIDILNSSTDKTILVLIANSLLSLAYYEKPESKALKIVINGLSKYLQDEQNGVYFSNLYYLCCYFQHIVLEISEKMSYLDFYRAWHSSSSSADAELPTKDWEVNP